MEENNKTNPTASSVWGSISALMYIICLCLPAFYSVSGEPQDSFAILLFGWIGIISLKFYWLANIFYLVALANARNLALSLWFSLAALATGLSFLMNGEIPDFNLSKDVGHYGLGYFLWISAFATLFISQVYESFNFEKTTSAKLKTVAIIQLLWFIPALFVFWDNFRFEDEIAAERAERMERYRAEAKMRYCGTSGRMPGNFIGAPEIDLTHSNKATIYFGLDEYTYKTFEKDESGRWELIEHESLLLPLLESGKIGFFEVKNQNPSSDKPYQRYFMINGEVETVEIYKTLSQFQVSVSPFKLDGSGDILGEEFRITEIVEPGERVKPFVKEKYYYEPEENLFCGDPDGLPGLLDDFLLNIDGKPNTHTTFRHN